MRKEIFWLLMVAFAAGCDDEGTDAPASQDAVLRADAAVDMEVVPPDAEADAMRPVDAAPPDAAPVDQGPLPDLGPPRPACDDGLDNDADGAIDLADPGCTDAVDDDEADPPRLCGNGLDDDGDGLIDGDDPGCESDGDFTEEDPERRPACANGRDDDADGAIDLADPGCRAAGDTDETDELREPACSNRADDDADGLTDYPADPGCGGPGDGNEADPGVLPACGNGLDDDEDGVADFPNDSGCVAASDQDETLRCITGHVVGDLNAAMASDGYAEGTTAGAAEGQRGTCGGDAGGEVMFSYTVATPLARVVFSTVHAETLAPTVVYVRTSCGAAEDLACNRGSAEVPGTEAILDRPQPGTYFVVVDTSSRMIGPGAFRLTATEVPLAICDDGLDNDADGRVDFPDEPGCTSPDDQDEADPDPLPACSDGIDNDADEAIDFPLDPECESAAGEAEAPPGCMNQPNLHFIDDMSVRLELAPEGQSLYQGGCGGARGPEEVVLLRVRRASRLRVETVAAAGGQTYDTLLYIRSGSCDQGAEVACDDDGGAGTLSLISTIVQPGDYYIFSDAFSAGAGPIGLEIGLEPLGAACDDGQDNDADGRLDGDDPGCTDPEDDDEADPAAGDAACIDGADNDGDGLADFPLDPGCAGRGDDDEADPAVAPACSNGLDDDDDGLIDFPVEPGCASAADDREADPADRPACADGADDDGDRLIDLADPGCYAAGDLSEVDHDAGACRNGLDDDGDGAVDFPFDPGCAFIGDLTEQDLPVAPTCANGIDDDGDGVTDFPADPGCAFAADPDEANPAALPACANGLDDDGDGLVDFPNDPGCFAAGDANEVNPAACADGADNDGDGQVDQADPGCANVLDDDETDPAGLPACANGADDDGDGAIDFPDDPECVAAGSPSEVAACGELAVPTFYVGQAGGEVAFVPRPAPGLVAASCGVEFGSETLIVLTLDQPSHVQATFTGSVRRYVRRICDDANSQIQCETPASANALSLFNAAAGTYYIFVEPNNDVPAPVRATIRVTPAASVCNNGEDDDGDDLVDAFDPGCRDAFDRDEADRDTPPACANGIDDDADGRTDYPDDQECRYAGGLQEVSVCAGLAVEVASFDAEGGELVFQLEAGGGAAAGTCGAGGAAEQVIAVTLEERGSISLNVRDGDGQASVILYARRSCSDPGSEVACASSGGSLRLDDVPQGTWYFFVERSAFTRIEPLTATVLVQNTTTDCNDGLDGDGDGLIDLDDPGCQSPSDEGEEDPAEPPACANGLDDDGDGQADYPNDFGCLAAGGVREALTCAATEDVIEVVVTPGEPQRIPYDTTDRPNLFEATCGGSARSPDQPFALVVPTAVTGRIEIADFGRDSVLHMRRACDDAASQVVCDDDGADVGLLSRLQFPRLEPGIYYVFADGFSNANSGPGTLVIDFQVAPSACGDGRDNDADGLVDLADPGCEGADDEDEFNDPLPACSNRVDDDADTLIDLDDPGCNGPDDQDEFNNPLPACSNRLDDDRDGRIDAADPGCEGPDDPDEVNPALCDDAVDNDDDGLVDLADPGCANPGDDDEADPAELPECSDGVDNDDDGATDWPDDAECLAAGGVSEISLCLGHDDVVVVEPQIGVPLVVPFDTMGRANAYQTTCGGTAVGPDQVFAVLVPAASSGTFEVTDADHDTVVHVRAACDDAASQLDCDDDGGAGLLSLAEVAELVPGLYFVFVDGFGANAAGPGELTITLTAP